MAYRDRQVEVPAGTVDGAFVRELGQLITRLATETPARRVPSPGECDTAKSRRGLRGSD